MKLKGQVFRDKHPDRNNRVFAIVWEASRFVSVYSTAGRVSRISKHRLDRYEPLPVNPVDTNTKFKKVLDKIAK
jgi:hypothetical protein